MIVVCEVVVMSMCMDIIHHSPGCLQNCGVCGQESGLGVDPFDATGPQSQAWALKQMKCILLEMELVWNWCDTRLH
jgi:hypothetical protein